MTDTYVHVHGAWHTGELMEPVAAHLRQRGHTAHCPTLAGNLPDDDRSTAGLAEAAQSLIDFLNEHDLMEVRLMGHSYGCMVIGQAADRVDPWIRRLVYWSAVVPLDGESLNDLVPQHCVALFDGLAAANNGAVMQPYPIWRKAFINDADATLTAQAFGPLNQHTNKTFTDKARLSTPLGALPMGKSYVNIQLDTALPHSLPWHPRLSERLGLFRLVECQGSNELWFTDAARLADAIERAGRDWNRDR